MPYKDKEAQIARSKAYYLANKEEIKKRVKEYRLENLEKIKETKLRYRTNNKDKVRETNSKYYSNNKVKCLISNKNRKKLKLSSNPIYKITESIRTRIYNSLKAQGYSKGSSSYEILGCSKAEFISHIEAQFEHWMNWSNWGAYNGDFNSGWDLDHLIPMSKANSERHALLLNHYKNFRPLCSKVNRTTKQGNFGLNIVGDCVVLNVYEFEKWAASFGDQPIAIDIVKDNNELTFISSINN